MNENESLIETTFSNALKNCVTEITQLENYKGHRPQQERIAKALLALFELNYEERVKAHE